LVADGAAALGGVDGRSLELCDGSQGFDDPALCHRAVLALVNKLSQLGTKRLQIGKLAFHIG
jgi:hypothetical protein